VAEASAANDKVRDHLRQCVHDLNNVLGQVLGFGSLLVKDIGDAHVKGQVPSSLLTYAEELLAAGLRGEAITKELGALVRSMQDSAPPPQASDSPPAETAGPRGLEMTRKGRIMMVGAADLAASPVVAALRDAHWSVETYRSGAMALRAFRASPESFDAVVTLQAIPEIRGTELITAVRALKPTVACVILLDDPKTDQTAAQLAGANECVAATIAGADLVARVGQWVNRLRPAS
jgi:PleD family two-component response regulator